MKKIACFVIIPAIFLVISACSEQTGNPPSDGVIEPSPPTETGDRVIYQLVAAETEAEVEPGLTLPFYTYGGTVPGQEIRVKQGQQLEVQLSNRLKEPITIHWHGYPVPNDMDGVPGLTQNAVQPGETFTYSFKAKVAGTYWYHSHQNSNEQVDKGLYGALIVEAEDDPYQVDREYVLILDEMNRDGSAGSAGGMMGRMMGGGASSYDIFTVNGKAGESIPDYPVKTGEKLRLRFINAGYTTHYMHLGSVPYKVIAVDGQIAKQPVTADNELLPVAPGERYDVLIEVPDAGFFIRDMLDDDAADGLRIPVVNLDSDRIFPERGYSGIFKISESQIGSGDWEKVAAPSYDKEYHMALSHGMSMGGVVYQINGRVFPDTEPLDVRKGDRVKVTLESRDPMFDHPMHLHGHFFQVLSKNGRPLKGDPVMKDTLLIRPGETYEVAFIADNPGDWMFHCHDLNHASDGMVTTVDYEGHEIADGIDRSHLKE